MKKIATLIITLIICTLTACTAAPTLSDQTEPVPAAVSTDTPQANMPNPASAYCEQQGYQLVIRTADDGSQTGYCLFPDGRACDEWAYYRGECGPDVPPTEIPTPLPFSAADYQGWWTYTHPVYNFTIMLPEDWVVEETTTFDLLWSGHHLSLHPNFNSTENIRLTFRRLGEDVPLWPTGVGQGEFIQQGTLDIAGQPARRVLLVCPTGEVTAIWYHNADSAQPNITRGDMEFGFIYSIGSHCDPGLSLGGKIQRVGEMIIASLKVP